MIKRLSEDGMEHEGEDTDNILILDLGDREEREREWRRRAREEREREREREETYLLFCSRNHQSCLQVGEVPGNCNEK